MKVWDLHCDTLAELRYAEQAGSPKDFARSDLMIDLERLEQADYLLQCFACFVDLDRAEDPLLAVMEEIDIYHRLIARYPDRLMPVRSPEDIAQLPGGGRVGAMLTVEEGGVCLGSPGVLRNLYRLGVRMMTLTWNHPNNLAGPAIPPDYSEDCWPVEPARGGGLTPLGLEFVREMERLKMIVDVSHLSDAGILDMLHYARRPFAASHSNARACCPHLRNLTDEMIAGMGERGCLIGLNYCGAFLNDTPDRRRTPSRVEDMVRHAHHILDKGGEDILALGSDFDGISGELELRGAQDLPRLAEALCRGGFTERQVEKIFYKNALRFFADNL